MYDSRFGCRKNAQAPEALVAIFSELGECTLIRFDVSDTQSARWKNASVKISGTRLLIAW
jgi:hypothetical protein